MQSYLDCIPGFIRQGLDSARFVTDDAKVHEQVVRGVLRLMTEMDLCQNPPAMARDIHRLIRLLVGDDDPYHLIKMLFNKMVLKLYPKLRKLIIGSEDPLATAVRLAIAGNIIDFGVNSTLQQADLEKAISECLTTNSHDMQLKLFQKALTEAEDILYLADNAGEIIFDRLLIEQLPIEKVTVVVRGKPVINDATMEDAVLAGLLRIVEVIDNGSDVPGTILSDCSEIFSYRFARADLIIAKGQGNYESLSEADKNIFFMLKAKCHVIAEHLGCEVGEMILKRSKSFNGVVHSVTETK
jgi:uncharacterized protein with ATP-grasp and redox domains